jgi:hypothetical protein
MTGDNCNPILQDERRVIAEHIDEAFLPQIQRLADLAKAIHKLVDRTHPEASALARHAAEIGDELYGDVDVFREQVQGATLATV